VGTKPVLAKCIEPFFTFKDLIAVCVTVPQGHLERVNHLLRPFFNMDDISIVTGGKTRQESVCLALERLKENSLDYVLIHDGARPWADTGLFSRVIEGMIRHNACIPVIDMTDAIKEVDGSGFIIQSLDRNPLKRAQTPQGFAYPAILEAHRKAVANGDSALDDAELYGKYCGRVFTVKGDLANKKITYKSDLEKL
jgi:2-C-methyl-D-erythritol 4-phosphate cytidylyltransferase